MQVCVQIGGGRVEAEWRNSLQLYRYAKTFLLVCRKVACLCEYCMFIGY
jgi:hypothetical protein